jgi:hypothetical protein
MYVWAQVDLCSYYCGFYVLLGKLNSGEAFGVFKIN